MKGQENKGDQSSFETTGEISIFWASDITKGQIQRTHFIVKDPYHLLRLGG